ncbi:MAG: hypothetical protein QOE27_2383 [Solirubrobacteraceae bacterium]|jgi:hypothetical protein|nr:hypothetical protein [Solirubrobacteraceae bacterium]MEA2300364.1 hypothetical protein [Solirubrobacteraceae bacterium]MEA2356303.1 hypothetical protein [Solirubrobacteraceae bacterium]
MAQYPHDQPFRAPVEAQPTGISDADEAAAARAANRFDIRRIIGGLFCLYAVILLVTGITGDHTVKTRADGINIDLWTGGGMLVVGIVMIAWALLRPVTPEPPETRGEGSGRIRRAPAT